MGWPVCRADPRSEGFHLIFKETEIKGAFLIEPEKSQDQRGYFARIWCQRELAAHGLDSRLAQCSVSYNRKRATLRGMHYQVAPHQESKLVRCIRGAIHDVIIDLRPESETFKCHFATQLSAANHEMLYIPEGFAHGFQTLEDDTEILYLISQFHAPESARGVRWNDPAFAIAWPPGDRIISDRDRTYPDFSLQRADK
jgi:dTDP-4-dehydrorhamnose 3,5-epimerase